MTGEVLRQAAALMRERAEAARSGVWEADHAAVTARWANGPRPVAMCSGSLPEGNAMNADHIASWHPAVALAVADWLDHQAEWLDRDTKRGRTPTRGDDYALAVATAYLGEQS